MAAANLVRAPAVYITHGGGPFPVIGGPGHAKLTAFLKAWPQSLPQPPKALLVISGHWETAVPTVTSAPQPDLIYDYGGFPPESYSLKYPAPGSPELADTVCSLLKAAGMECRKDSKRGWDHGTFIPLMLMFPKADIPVVQLSLVSSLDPQLHIRMGEALSTLRDQGVAIIGSGSSFHNMGALFAAMGDEAGLTRAGDRQAQPHIQPARRQSSAAAPLTSGSNTSQPTPPSPTKSVPSSWRPGGTRLRGPTPTLVKSTCFRSWWPLGRARGRLGSWRLMMWQWASSAARCSGDTLPSAERTGADPQEVAHPHPHGTPLMPPSTHLSFGGVARLSAELLLVLVLAQVELDVSDLVAGVPAVV